VPVQRLGELLAGVHGCPANGQLLTAAGRDQVSSVDRIGQLGLVVEYPEVAKHHREHVVGVERERIEPGEFDPAPASHHGSTQMSQLVEGQQPLIRLPLVPI